MGRKKKYLTDEAKRLAQNSWSKGYYERHKEELDTRAKERYHELRKNIHPDNTKSKQ